MHKIAVSNFMALDEVEVEVKGLTLFLGEQAVGKSTLSKLIYFYRSLKDDFIDNIIDLAYNDENHGNNQSSFYVSSLWRKIAIKFYNYFGSTRHLSPFTITYEYEAEKTLTLGLKEDKSLDINFSKALYQAVVYGDAPNRVQKIKQVSAQRNTAERRAFQQELTSLESLSSKIFNDPYMPLFIPAGRNITVNYSSQFQREFYGELRHEIGRIKSEGDLSTSMGQKQSADMYLMAQFLDHIYRLIEQFKDKSLDDLIAEYRSLYEADLNLSLQAIIDRFHKILKGRYTHDKYGEKIYINQESYVYLQNASSGQQEAIRILQDAFMIALYQERTFRVIEEPEAHLYPLAQKALIEVLAIVLNSTSSQLILTTHSPYILSIVNNLLFAYRVVAKNPMMREQVHAIVPQEAWLNPETVAVYFLAEGQCENIFDAELGLIDQNRLDEISEELGHDFERLYDFHSQSFQV